MAHADLAGLQLQLQLHTVATEDSFSGHRSDSSETMGGIGPALLELLKDAAERRGNKLTHGEYETEATWSTRKYMPFVMQRISIAVQMAAALEIRQALGVGLAPE